MTEILEAKTEASSRTHVLIVDDEVDIRETIGDVLLDAGFSVILLPSGSEAIEWLGKSPIVPCVILLDLMMPRMDGTQFMEAKAKVPALTDVPVVVLSASNNVAQMAVAIHAQGFIKKPVRMKDLLTSVRQHCPHSPACAGDASPADQKS